LQEKARRLTGFSFHDPGDFAGTRLRVMTASLQPYRISPHRRRITPSMFSPFGNHSARQTVVSRGNVDLTAFDARAQNPEYAPLRGLIVVSTL
jgi:hypothetical protein